MLASPNSLLMDGTPAELAAAADAAILESMQALADYTGPAVVDMMLHADEGQAEGENSPTTEHALHVAALTGVFMSETASVDDRRSGILAGALHDIVKVFDPDINELVHNGRRLTDAEFDIVRSHAPRGGVMARRLLSGSGLSDESVDRIADAIARHHSDPGDDPLAALLQVADKSHGALIDPTRTYREARMRSEGFLDPEGRPVPGRIAADILRGQPETAFGVPLEHLVAMAIDLMPMRQRPAVAVA